MPRETLWNTPQKRTISMSTPVSSRVSRTAAAASDSPSSTWPPGISQPRRGPRISSTWWASSRTTAAAETMCRGAFMEGSAWLSMLRHMCNMLKPLIERRRGGRARARLASALQPVQAGGPQRHGERRALPHRRLHAELVAEAPADLRRQEEPHAGRRLRAAPVGAGEEALEDPRHVLGRDAHALVGHAQARRAAPQRARLHPHAAAARAVLDGVGEQLP